MSRAGGGEPGVARDSKVSGAGALRVETTDDAREGRRSGYACTLRHLKEAGLRPTSNESDWCVGPGGGQTRICQVHSACSVESGSSETEPGGRVAR